MEAIGCLCFFLQNREVSEIQGKLVEQKRGYIVLVKWRQLREVCLNSGTQIRAVGFLPALSLLNSWPLLVTFPSKVALPPTYSSRLTAYLLPQLQWKKSASIFPKKTPGWFSEDYFSHVTITKPIMVGDRGMGSADWSHLSHVSSLKAISLWVPVWSQD